MGGAAAAPCSSASLGVAAPSSGLVAGHPCAMGAAGLLGAPQVMPSDPVQTSVLADGSLPPPPGPSGLSMAEAAIALQSTVLASERPAACAHSNPGDAA